MQLPSLRGAGPIKEEDLGMRNTCFTLGATSGRFPKHGARRDLVKCIGPGGF